MYEIDEAGGDSSTRGSVLDVTVQAGALVLEARAWGLSAARTVKCVLKVTRGVLDKVAGAGVEVRWQEFPFLLILYP